MVLNRHGAIGLGEIGDEDAAPIMAKYTAGIDRLHMAYSFGLLTSEFSATHVRQVVQHLDASNGHGGGWTCWSLSNHDVPRVLSRWGGANPDRRLAKLLLSLVASLRGSVCLYQGEELGLTEADVAFEDIRDPYGIPFWPEFKGRDGCRTPFPWFSSAPNAGFSAVKPWLPVSAAHLPVAVNLQQEDAASVLRFYQGFIAWRAEHPVLKTGNILVLETPEPVLMYLRTAGDVAILCVFNLSAESVALPLNIALRSILPTFVPDAVQLLDGHGLEAAALHQEVLTLTPYGGMFAHVVLGATDLSRLPLATASATHGVKGAFE